MDAYGPMTFGDHKGREAGFVRPVPHRDLGSLVGQKLHDLGVVSIGGAVHRGFAVFVHGIHIRAELQ